MLLWKKRREERLALAREQARATQAADDDEVVETARNNLAIPEKQKDSLISRLSRCASPPPASRPASAAGCV